MPRLTGHSWKERHELAGKLREALSVTSETAVGGKHVLVYDDIFTDGHTLNEVARALTSAGAKQVCGVSLMRQPFTPKTA